MRNKWVFSAVVLAVGAAAPAMAATLTVGPGKTYTKPCQAIAAAQAGDVIEVDAAGSYAGDTCAWSTDNLTVRGVNGRAKIDITGVTPVQQKGLFTIAANNATIENMELSGAAISAGAGNNGAGIRHQGLNLTVRNCYFHDNQNGILGAPATANMGQVLIENSEFANNGAGDGFTHNMYIGNYAQFTLRYSYSHAVKVGHLVKSRAYTSMILYNRITDEVGGTGSYEVDLPNGGTAYLIGNLIEQSAASQNPTIIAFGEEGTTGYDDHLFVVNNTILNNLKSGTFVNDVGTSPAALTNNIFWNGGKIASQTSAVLTANYDSSLGDPKFTDVTNFDVHLLAGSPCIDQGKAPGSNNTQSLQPTEEYVQPISEVARSVGGAAIDIGAYEYQNPSLADGGTSTSGTDGGTAGDGGTTGPGGTMTGGCGCVIGGIPLDAGPGGAAGILLGLSALIVRRRRR